jgi:DNA invertase Pin-like site-specific DNA recombinase
MRAFARSMRRGNSCQHCANYDEVSARAVKENTERPPALPEFLARHPHITFVDGLAEFERELIRARAGNGRIRAKAAYHGQGQGCIDFCSWR